MYFLFFDIHLSEKSYMFLREAKVGILEKIKDLCVV